MYRLVIDLYFLTKTETATKGGLDPTAEAIGVVQWKLPRTRTTVKCPTLPNPCRFSSPDGPLRVPPRRLLVRRPPYPSKLSASGSDRLVQFRPSPRRRSYSLQISAPMMSMKAETYVQNSSTITDVSGP